MSTDESDDEPLSVLAAAKKLNPENFEITIVKPIDVSARKKKRNPPKKPSITITLARVDNNEAAPKFIEKPADVWLYLKDLNPTGPYSCLLCSDWFINRTKIMLHYILNHKKDFCGICRYFVPNRQAWWDHQKFHIPWGCSQCSETFPEESEMRHHLSSVHNLVHCRLCHFRMTDDEQYNTHLLQKHNITNMESKSLELLWKLEYEGSPKYHCHLCSKAHLATNFFNHNMGYHHFTLRCISSIISGHDIPFTVNGADVSSQFVDGELNNQLKCGYIESEQVTLEETGFAENNSHDSACVDNNTNNMLVPEIKQEFTSDVEESKDDDDPDKSDKNNIVNTYKGEEDFDVTLMELIVLQTCYFEYIDEMLREIDSNVIPVESRIDSSSMQLDFRTDVVCPLCKMNFNTMQMFTLHIGKMHSVRTVPVFSCRICSNNFETKQELTNHEKKETTEFDDLWICQFCDKEFDDREDTRKHLDDHKDIIEFDNCFSPHLGFKCKYCPTLFWKETDRNTHQVKVHFSEHMEDFYKCQCCTDEIYSDKVWYVHHYLSKHHQEDTIVPYLLKCCLCCLVLPSIDNMRSHFKSHHPEARKIFCSLGACMYKPLSQRKSFKIHVKALHGSEGSRPGNTTCVICGRDFSSVRACSTHMSQVHGPGKFKCKLCREVMHSLDERKLHYLIRHPGRHPFECNECGKSFQYKSSLYMHKQEHSPVKQSYTCSYCGKVFAKKDSFREHVQIHTGPRHACSYCPKRFVQRSNMLRHERRHTGERPYACAHCPRTFADKGACTSHTRTHTRDRSYSCLYCGQTFVQKSKLTYHIRKHTGENLETCPICSKLFTSACSLREHMKTHEKKKGPVSCPLCNREYVDQKCMIRHLKTAHTRGRFTCPVCHKAISTPSSLRSHVLTHSELNIHRCKVCPKSYSCKRTMVKHLRRRHNLKGASSTDYFITLDPRQCRLGLDEETITEIFGPPKEEVLLKDYVTIADIQLNTNQGNDTSNDERDNDKTDEEGESGTEDVETEGHVVVDLEPTDFVSVKVEPMDYEENSE